MNSAFVSDLFHVNETKEVYLTCFRMKHYKRVVEEQDVIHEILYHSGLDTENKLRNHLNS